MRLEADPLAESRNIKNLRPNPFADREPRLQSRYRVLFSVDETAGVVVVHAVGEKVGNALVVRGRRFTAHESDPAQ